MPSPLPQRTLDFLSAGAPEGARNQEMHFAAQQFRDAGYPENEAIWQIGLSAVRSGISQEECAAAVRSAYRQAKRKPIHGQQEFSRSRNTYNSGKQEWKPKPITNAEPRALPEPIVPGLETFLRTCFKPGEFISIGRGHPTEEGDRIVPDGGETRTIGGWLDWIKSFKPKNGLSPMDRSFFGSQGLYVRVNPVKEGGEKDTDVTEFRHCLVEFDSINKENQLGAILQSTLPISVITDSAGKSVHAWIRVDARDRREFDERVRIVHEVFSEYGIDTANKNPSRYSRLPDGKRGDKRQHLLMTNVGASSWDDWMDANEDDGLPPIISLDDLLGKELPEPPQIVKGVLHKGCKMVVGGPTKARKTWVVMDLALSVANGVNWMGMECAEGSVLYLNFELIEFTFKQRWNLILDNKIGCNGKNIETWTLRGHAADIAHLVDKISRRIKKKSYDLIIIDPIYKSLGNRDENAAGDMNDLLNYLEKLAVASGASIAIAAHFPKGNMGARESMDRIAGSGVFARDPDAVITMSPHENASESDETVRFVIDLNLRNFVEQKQFVVMWSPPMMIRDTVKPRAKGSGGRPSKGDGGQGDIIPHLPASMEELIQKTGLSKATLKRRVKEARLNELIEKDLYEGKYTKAQAHNPYIDNDL